MKDVIYKILWATIEDFPGLWEIHWELNSIFPKKSKKENLELAKKILLFLLDTGLVILYFNKWGNDEMKKLNIEEAKKIVNQNKFWDAPLLYDTCVKVGNTEKGKKYYNEKLLTEMIF